MSGYEPVAGQIDLEAFIAEDVLAKRLCVSPEGLERAICLEDLPFNVTVQLLKEAVDRYSARKTSVPGSYAHKHYVETGHALRFGCCLDTEAA